MNVTSENQAGGRRRRYQPDELGNIAMRTARSLASVQARAGHRASAAHVHLLCSQLKRMVEAPADGQGVAGRRRKVHSAHLDVGSAIELPEIGSPGEDGDTARQGPAEPLAQLPLL